MQLFINEIDSEQTGTDAAEFVELYTPEGQRSLNGLVLVLFNGNGDVSYSTLELSGLATDANGFFIVGPAGMTPAPDLAAPATTNWLQNGPDAVAIYRAAPAAFPNGSAPSVTGLLDALVYDATSNTTAAGLLTGLGQGSQIIEDVPTGGGNSAIARRGDGRCAWMNQAPTPKATNGPDITYAVWEAMHPGIGAATDDPDADGLTNSHEFFFGGNPLTAEPFPATPLVTADPGPRRGFTFRKRACPSSQVTCALQSSTDLAAWTPVPYAESARTINSDGTETVTWIETTAAASGARRFLRIHGAQTP